MVFCMKYLKIAVSSFLLSVTANLEALTLDNFTAVGKVDCPTEDVWLSSSVGSNGSVGGNLTLRCYKDAGAQKVHISTNSGFMSHSQDFGVKGRSRIEWDGDSDSMTTNFNGLSLLDLTQDGGDAFVLHEVGFDCATGSGGAAADLRITMRVYDGRDSGGDTYVESELKLPCSPNVTYPKDFEIPFKSFVTADPSVQVSFAKVGALRLSVVGLTDSADLSMGKISTNGKCLTVPPPSGKVIDLCGVCGGDNSTCKDCAGIPLGNSKVDSCGVCGGDGQSCVAKCQTTDQGTVITALSGKTDEFIQNVLFFLTRLANSDPVFAKRTKKEVKAIKNSLTTSIQSLPFKTTVCAETSVCTKSTVNATVLAKMDLLYDKLYQISVNVLSKPTATPGGKCNGSLKECTQRQKSSAAKSRSLKVFARKLQKEAKSIKASYPGVESNCPPGVG